MGEVWGNCASMHHSFVCELVCKFRGQFPFNAPVHKSYSQYLNSNNGES